MVKSCIKFNSCSKIDCIADKDMLDFQYSNAIKSTCANCKDGYFREPGNKKLETIQDFKLIDRTLAIKFGFKEESKMGLIYWKYPDGKSSRRDPPPFHSSMDACIKWIFPYFWIIKMDLLDAIFYIWEVAHPSRLQGMIKGEINESCSLAFCSAVIRFFEGEVNDS